MGILKIKSVRDLTDETNIEDRVNVLTLILDELLRYKDTVPDELIINNIFDNSIKKHIIFNVPIKKQYESGNTILNLMLELFEEVERYEDCSKVLKIKQQLTNQFGKIHEQTNHK